MERTYFIALGPKANGFFDQITGITVARGEKKEITERQKNTRKVQSALNAGALQLVQPDHEVKNISDIDAKKLDKKVKEKLGKGVTFDKICSNLTIEQAKALADLHEIAVDDKDTISDIMEAVVTDYEEDK